MRDSIGYTVTLNFAITFIIIVFAILSATLIYFKNNKSSKIITDVIEKYEGYSKVTETEVEKALRGVFDFVPISCSSSVSAKKGSSLKCNLVPQSDDIEYSNGGRGYCVYLCEEGEYYYYRVKTNVEFSVPIIGEWIKYPVYSNTDRMFDFEANFQT